MPNRSTSVQVTCVVVALARCLGRGNLRKLAINGVKPPVRCDSPPTELCHPSRSLGVLIHHRGDSASRSSESVALGTG